MKKKLLLMIVCMSVFLNACGNKSIVEENKDNPKDEVEKISGEEENDNEELTNSVTEKSKEKLDDTFEITMEPINISNVNVGDIIKFGNYEQDDNKNNGKEEIEWYVIDVEDDFAILMSVYALECKKYNDDIENVTWEKCSLRQWLNNNFYNSAFNENEKSIIRVTYLENKSNSKSGISGGNSTQDRVFILSFDEASEYFEADKNASKSNPFDYHLSCLPTHYAERKGAQKYENCNTLDPDNDTTCMYWFRTVGKSQNKAVDMNVAFMNQSGSDVNDSKHGVRPCITVNLNGVVSSDMEN